MRGDDGTTVEVVDHRGADRYEAFVGGRRAGILTYRRRPDGVVLVHTEVDREFEGRGVGSRLVAGALDDLRARGVGVVPRCPFVAAFVERHPEYRDLVVADR
jgi:predicted GNAT family acetyltransferase